MREKLSVIYEKIFVSLASLLLALLSSANSFHKTADPLRIE
jgi:hypothetical protein